MRHGGGWVRDLPQGGLTRGGCPHCRSRYRQRRIWRAYNQVRNGPTGPTGGRFRPGHAGRRDRRAVRDHRVQAAEGEPGFLPAHRGRGRADVRGGPDSRLFLPSGGPSVRGRHPDLPAHRPAAAPVLRQGPAQRDPDRRDDPRARPAAPVRRGGDQRRVHVHPAGGPAVLRPHRRGPGRADQGPVGGLPDARAAGRGHLRHGGGRPDARRRRRGHHDGRGRVHPRDAQADRRRGQRRGRADRGDGGRGPGGGQAVHPGAVRGAAAARRRGRHRARRPSTRSSSTTPRTSTTRCARGLR